MYMQKMNEYSTKWVIRPKIDSQAPLRLFCLPYAGGGASIFRDWPNHLSAQAEICPVQLPGRESRLREAPMTHLHALIESLAYALRPYMDDKPFALFGHSMGALLCFELARFLGKKYALSPVHFFVSGCRAPHRQNRDLNVSNGLVSDSSDSALIERIRKLNGTSQIILQDDALMKLLLPVFRADFTLCDTYSYVDDDILDCPVSAFGGLQDEGIKEGDLVAWQELTSGKFTIRMLPGDHFFLQSSQTLLLDAISINLRSISCG